MFPVRNFKIVQKARAAPILWTRAALATNLPAASCGRIAGSTHRASPARWSFTQTGGGLSSPLGAAAILTGLEGAFLCVLCSRGEAAPRLPVRQRAALEAYGTRARLGEGCGRGILGPKVWGPGAATRGPQGSEAPPTPHRKLQGRLPQRPAPQSQVEPV